VQTKSTLKWRKQYQFSYDWMILLTKHFLRNII
jgi:hypothetical protein